MILAPGTKLGPYEILAQIGAGGMGEVYRARDPRVGRDVAIKVSSEQFSDRFAREIHAVAALNHSNVCTLYDVGPNYLVMELVEGPTLADRIRQGPIPLEESLEIANQIADALEAAHEKGIVHRDLKPGNIKLRPDGMVKVLDFGLAKVEETAPVSLETSPTLSVAQTAAGVLLGTAAYMSPEQARGKPVDKRADIWAFGVVLYEMLTGKQLFSGETVSDTLAATLKEEPDFEKVPAKVRPLLRSCLDKNPSRRLRDIGDAMALLEGVPDIPQVKRRWFAWSVAGVLLLALLFVSFLYFRPKTPVLVEPVRFQITLPEGVAQGPGPGFVLSPDGLSLAFAIKGSDDLIHVCVRRLDSQEAQPLPGTEYSVVPHFFWSPDSRFLLYMARDSNKAYDIWMLEMESGPKAVRLLGTDFNEGAGVFSRDMRWLAYTSDESGSSEVYVREFSQNSAGGSVETGGKRQVSKGGGIGPRWREDGKELFYLTQDGKVMAVPVTADTEFRPGTPVLLFQSKLSSRYMTAALNTASWDIDSNGSRFLLTVPASESPAAQVNVILNWTSLLKK